MWQSLNQACLCRNLLHFDGSKSPVKHGAGPRDFFPLSTSAIHSNRSRPTSYTRANFGDRLAPRNAVTPPSRFVRRRGAFRGFRMPWKQIGMAAAILTATGAAIVCYLPCSVAFACSRPAFDALVAPAAPSQTGGQTLNKRLGVYFIDEFATAPRATPHIPAQPRAFPHIPAQPRASPHNPAHSRTRRYSGIITSADSGGRFRRIECLKPCQGIASE